MIALVVVVVGIYLAGLHRQEQNRRRRTADEPRSDDERSDPNARGVRYWGTNPWKETQRDSVAVLPRNWARVSSIASTSGVTISGQGLSGCSSSVL